MSIRILCSIVFFFTVSCLTYAQTIVIIVNPENPIRDVSLNELKHIFTAGGTVWEDGNSIQIVDWKTDNDVKRLFYAEILKKSPAAVRRGWIQKIVAGNIYPPSVLSSEEEIINFVATHRWAIAYVERKSMPGTVKTITVDGYTPDNAEYRLK